MTFKGNNAMSNAETLPIEARVLEEAKKCICHDRKDQYGNAEDAFQDIADVASVILRNKLKRPLSAKDVAMFMVALKLVREQHQHKFDNLVDGAGYFALIARIMENEKETGMEDTINA
jgi:hypothetical protein